jgi:hypothetical protein
MYNVIHPRRQKKEAPLDLADVIDHDLIHPVVLQDIESCILARKRWKLVSDWTEGVAHLLLAVNGILSFLSGAFNGNAGLSISAGVTATLCIVLLKYSSYASSECEERHTTLCRYLEYFHVRPPPLLSARSTEDRVSSPRTTPTEDCLT